MTPTQGLQAVRDEESVVLALPSLSCHGHAGDLQLDQGSWGHGDVPGAVQPSRVGSRESQGLDLSLTTLENARPSTARLWRKRGGGREGGIGLPTESQY